MLQGRSICRKKNMHKDLSSVIMDTSDVVTHDKADVCS